MRRMDQELAGDLAKEIDQKNPHLHTPRMLTIVDTVNTYLINLNEEYMKTQDKFFIPGFVKTGNVEIDENPVILKSMEKVRDEVQKKSIEYKRHTDLMSFEYPLLIVMLLLKKENLSDWKKHVITGMILSHFTYGQGPILSEFWYNKSKYVKEREDKELRYKTYKHYLAGKIRDYVRKKNFLLTDTDELDELNRFIYII